jgi:hypothetical protein
MSNNNTPLTAPLMALGKLIEQSARVGIDALESLADFSPHVLQSLGNLAASGSPLSGSCTCDIPPSCWMPKALCDVNSSGRTGDTVSLCFVITNCSMTVRKIALFTSTKNSGLSFSANEVDLGPMDRREVDVSYVIPAGSLVGDKTELLMWVRGCKVHFLRWTVTVGSKCADTCYEVEVKDCPDLIHHWYDHFYCSRPCLGDREAGR